MSRRMDREGVHRMTPQGIKNRRLWDDPRCVEDAKGWLQPFANWQGWEEFNHAEYALRCVLHLKQIPLSPAGPIFLLSAGTLNRDQMHRANTLHRMQDDLRSFHFHLGQSRKCDRPRLP